MERAELKEYLEILIDMEKSALLQNNAIRQMQGQIRELKQTKDIIRPVEPQKVNDTGFPGHYIMLGVGILLAIWGLNVLKAPGFLSFFGGIVVMVFAVCFLIFGVLIIWEESSAINKKRSTYNREAEAYPIALAKYEREVAEECARTEKNTLKATAYEHELNLLLKGRQQTEEALTKMYEADIVYPKYRNLPMLCSMYEYIASGRAEALEGADGAYNTLEKEMRLDKIITKLDSVIAQLNQIRNNQYMLYTTMVEANEKTNTIIVETQDLADRLCALQQSAGASTALLASQVEEMKKSSAASAYFAERTAKELQYMNRMNYLTGRNDGPIVNVPPSL